MNDVSPVNAPYNFVPFSERVVDDWEEPALNGVPSHDMPYAEGMSGEISFEIVADSPLLVAGPDQDDKVKRFFRGPDGNPAIPGSAIRGMIRNVVEIASFSRFKLVEDRRLGLRDLSGAVPDYTNKLTETVNGAYRSRAEAGWLTLAADGTWQIEPCDFARVEQEDVKTIVGGANDLHSALRRTPYPKNAEEVYTIYPEFSQLRQVWIEPEKNHLHSGNKYLRYQKAHPRAATGLRAVEGCLVFTGQPSPKKHLEFVFFDDSGRQEAVPLAALAGFLAVHEAQEKPSETWQFWQQRLRDGTVSRIPVFYITDNADEIEAFGLSMMFKMAQKNSILELLQRHLAQHLDEEGVRPPDLAERLFGRVSSTPEQSFKGRVQFGLAELAPGSSWQEVREIKTSDGARRKLDTVLGAPKPSWFPAYLHQGKLDNSGKRLAGRNEREARSKYRTYMDDDAQLRGWKRYPVRGTKQILIPPPPPPSGISEDAKVKLTALLPRERGRPVCFRGTLRFHNLRDFELGALLWAITWMGDDTAHHRLGMGKPFGWGQVRIRCRGAKLRYNKPQQDGQRPIQSGDAALQAVFGTRETFEKKMEAFVTGWSGSHQIRSLLAMAKVQGDPPHALRDPRLDVDGRTNEFNDLKKTGAVLPYWGIEPPDTPDPQRGANRGGTPGGGRPPRGGRNDAGPRGGGSIAARPRSSTSLLFAAGTRVTDGDWEVTVDADVPFGATEMRVRDENNDTEYVDVADFRRVDQ